MQNPAKAELAQLIRDGIGIAYPKIQLEDKDLLYSISYQKGAERDISSSIALRLAKSVKSPPTEVAESIAKNMRSGRLVLNVSHLNGYINAKLDQTELAKLVLDLVFGQRDRYGSSDMGKSRKAFAEYPSVNPNKPWHVGHLRPALLGDSMARLMLFCSYKTERMDYIDDLGLQMGEILWGSMNMPWNQAGKKYDQFLGEQYVEINKRMKEPGVEDAVKELLKRMEEQGTEESKKVRGIAENCVRAQYETGVSYGIIHDGMVWESDILHEKLLEKSLTLLKERGIAKVQESGKYANCLVVSKGNPLDGEDDSKVLVRSTGAATYLAKDIAFHMWKLGMIKADFKFSAFMKQPDGTYVLSTGSTGEKADFGNADLAVNIIDSRQDLPQTILRNVLTMLDGNAAGALHHLSCGEVGLASGGFSGRKGTWLGDTRNYTADDLLREAKAKALEIIKGSEKALNDIDPEEVSKKVAVAAIKFDFLRIDPARKVVFDWNRALDFNSNSGPYCMYMYARASRILEKSGTDVSGSKPETVNCTQMGRGDEFALVKLISQCKEIVEKACTEYKPNIIADYVMELSLMFSKFYQSTDVLKSGDAKGMRLAIVWAARQTMGNMLGLLGIETIEKM